MIFRKQRLSWPVSPARPGEELLAGDTEHSEPCPVADEWKKIALFKLHSTLHFGPCNKSA